MKHRYRLLASSGLFSVAAKKPITDLDRDLFETLNWWAGTRCCNDAYELAEYFGVETGFEVAKKLL